GSARPPHPPAQPGGRFQGPPSALPAALPNRSAQRAAARHLKGAARVSARPCLPARSAALGPRGAALSPPPSLPREAARPPLAEGACPREAPPPPLSDWRSRPSISRGRRPARPRSGARRGERRQAGGRGKQRRRQRGHGGAVGAGALTAPGARRSGAGRAARAGPHPARRGTCSPRGKARPCPRTGRRGRSKRGGGEREGAGGCGAGGARLRALCGAGASPPPPRRPPPGSCRLALYVYEYLLHVGAQKSAQTFLSEIRWEKNITLGEPPGFLHSWWCVFWDLYCAAPERRDTCEHSSEAKAFHDYSAAAAPSPVLGNIPPNDGMPGGPIPPGFFQPFMSPRYAGGPRPPIRMGNQPPGAVPGTQPLLPNSMDPTRQQGHPNMGGPMQRMNPPRGMGPMGPGPQNYGSGMRPPPNSLGPGMPGINMGPGAGRPWPNPSSANSIPYSSSSPGTYVGPPGGGGPPGTPIMPSPADSTNSSDNIYTMINPVPPAGSRSNFPMGPGSDGPMGGMGGMEPHHMNGSLGSGDIDGLPKNSPNNISGISNPPGTPRDDGELGGNFLHSFQNDNYSPSMTMSV
uniref:Single stranded DNA binding protein 3 n=2 Tax=Sauria TaxID=32561 RepID=A0A669PAM1_PHACC